MTNIMERRWFLLPRIHRAVTVDAAGLWAWLFITNKNFHHPIFRRAAARAFLRFYVQSRSSDRNLSRWV